MTTSDSDGARREPTEIRAGLPAHLVELAGAAHDALEIAAALEAYGISSRVARERFGERDVFALARRLFDHTGSDAELAAPSFHRPKSRSGGPRELARGAMFAAPGLMFVGAIAALRLTVPAWAYLLALTLGWGVSQAVAASASALAGRSLAVGARPLWWLGATAVATAGLAAAGSRLLRGGASTVGFAALVAAYVVACAILLATSRTSAMVVPLVPATAIAMLFVLHLAPVIPRDVTIGVIAAAVALTIATALRGVPLRVWRAPRLGSSARAVAAMYFGNGIVCGLGTCLIIVLGQASGHTSVIPVAGYPVLVSLGVLEWQLYSFRARVDAAFARATSAAQFGRGAAAAFVVSLAWYFLALGLACAGAGAYLALRGMAIPEMVLGAEACLGCTFFVGLVASLCARIDVALWGGAVGVVTYLCLYVGARLTTGAFPHTVASRSCLIAIGAALVVSLVRSQRVIRSAFSYQ